MSNKENKSKEIEEIIDGELYISYETDLGSLEQNTTGRGFGIFTFKDMSDHICSIQDSSIATESCIWFGVNNANPKILASKIKPGGTGWVDYPLPDDVLLTTRMHLSQTQVKALLPILSHFAETGEYVRDFKPEDGKDQ